MALDHMYGILNHANQAGHDSRLGNRTPLLREAEYMFETYANWYSHIELFDYSTGQTIKKTD